MKFEPKSEADIKKANLLPDGTYDATIGTAEDTISSKGNEMIKLDVTVYDKNGNTRFIYDYLLEALAYKLRHAAEACGLLDEYAKGTLEAQDFIGKSCKVKVKIDSKNPDFPPKNVINDYITPDKSFIPKSVDEVLGEEKIPF
jgi:hypothetical protein